jgi:hypothetical protein
MAKSKSKSTRKKLKKTINVIEKRVKRLEKRERKRTNKDKKGAQENKKSQQESQEGEEVEFFTNLPKGRRKENLKQKTFFFFIRLFVIFEFKLCFHVFGQNKQ